MGFFFFFEVFNHIFFLSQLRWLLNNIYFRFLIRSPFLKDVIQIVPDFQAGEWLPLCLLPYLPQNPTRPASLRAHTAISHQEEAPGRVRALVVQDN